MMEFLSTNNGKAAKTLESVGIETYTLQLAPVTIAGVGNMCAGAGACAEVCIFEAGYGRMANVQAKRVDRTRKLFGPESKANRVRLLGEVLSLPHGTAVRLNTFSDVDWPKLLPDAFAMRPDLRFYDYTKIESRFARFMAGKLPDNYTLAYSFSERSNHAKVRRWLRNGARVSVVFRRKPFPATFLGAPTVDGTAHDAIFLQPEGSVIALKALHRGQTQEAGFVQGERETR